MEKLPIHDVLAELTAAVRASRGVVLQAPPGAGKTTSVAPHLLQHGAHGDGKILLVQPRRLAARSAAARLASMLDTPLGQRVGYHVRFDRKISTETELVVMTTGILLRQMQNDPLIEDVSCVILDEFHERSLELDLTLGMLQRVRTSLRPKLRLIVMSATLDPDPIARFLGDAVPITSQGRSFPVEVRHLENAKTMDRRSTISSVIQAIQTASTETPGDILVFLPGVGEIRGCEKALNAHAFADRFEVHQLYGDLPPAKQDAVLKQSNNPKIILATNVAETSITVAGITGVVDSGQARILAFDTRLGVPKLQLRPISQASAEQRAGRAGRTQSGIAYRLWPAATHQSRPQRDQPEIERSDFSGSLLTLLAWGENEVFDFPWLSPPPGPAVEQAQSLLVRLGAIHTETWKLTDIGKQMLRLPLPTRLSRFMIEAQQNHCQQEAAVIAAILSERDPFRNASMSIFEKQDAIMSGKTLDVSRDAIKNLRRVAKQIHRSLQASDDGEETPLPRNGNLQDRLAKSLLVAYPDRVACRRKQDPTKAVMVGRKGLDLRFASGMSHSGESSEWILALDLDGATGEAKVYSAIKIKAAWLPRHRIKTMDVPRFDENRQAVVMRRQVSFEDLLVTESPLQCEPSLAVAELLARHATNQLAGILSKQPHKTRQFIARVRFLIEKVSSHKRPNGFLSNIDNEQFQEFLHQTLAQLCQTRTKVSQLHEAPWLDFLRAPFDYNTLQWMDQNAPPRLTVPSGNAIAIEYLPEGPIMAVKIQELFGLKETPRLATGNVPVRLHLLGPNRRPQQITEDLQSFWAKAYAQVRKDLRGRYPKHHWPEDPLTAQATRNGLKPR